MDTLGGILHDSTVTALHRVSASPQLFHYDLPSYFLVPGGVLSQGSTLETVELQEEAQKQ